MHARPSSWLALTLFVCLLSPTTSAQVILLDRASRPPREPALAAGRMRLERYESEVAIKDDLVRATVRETFFNPAAGEVEGVFLFRPCAGIGADFRLFVDGSEVAGEMLDGEEARSALAELELDETDVAPPELGRQGLFRAVLPALAPQSRVSVVLTSLMMLAPSMSRYTYREPLAV